MTLSKRLSICLFAISASALSGCAHSRALVITEPVGPVGRAAPSPGTMGSLIVYSAWDRFDTLDAEHLKHTAYTVRSEQGAPVIHVRNRRGSFEGDPQAVSLAPGRYWVEAKATNVGLLKLPVVIRKGQTTVVYLDGLAAPSTAAGPATNWIRQPSGLIVGWRDQREAPTTERASVLQ